MKKLIFILFLFTCIKASAQIPIRSLTNVADKSLYVDNHFTPPRYDDTTQANLNLGLDSCGAIIFTRIDQKLWKRVCNPTKHWEEIGSGGSQDLEDTVYAKQPLYVDAGVKDTVKFNADSSGLVKNTFISGGNLYQIVNGDTSLVGGVGGSAGALTWLDVARNSFDIDENRSHLIYDSAINFELYKKHEYYCDFNVSTIDTLNGNNLYGSIGLYPGSAGLTSTGNTNSNFIIVNTDSVLISLNPDYNLNEQHGFYLKDTIAKLFNNRLIYETPPIGSSTDKIVSWDEGTGVVGVIDRDSIFSTPDYYGNFFKEKNFTDLSKFDVNGATVSVSGGNLNFSAGANTYTQSLDIKGNSALENFTITGRFKVGDKTGTSYGFGLGIRTTGVYAMYAFFNMTNGANSGKITLDNVVGLTTSTGLAFSVGDTIIFSLEKTRANIIVQAYNQTTKAAPLRLTYNYTIYSPSPSLSWYGKYAIFSKGGLFSVDSLSVFSKDIKNPDLLILGDSKTCAYQASNYSDGYAQMIQAKYKNTDIYAAPGFQLQNALTTTDQIISLNPKAVLMALGSNDIRSGRTFAQYTADYDTIVNRFIAAGIQVYHALPFYEKPISVKPLVDYIIATYPADRIIDTYNPMLATGALDTDTLHPSPAGHQAIYKTILNSNIIPGKKTFEQPLSAGAVAYGSFDGGLSNDDNFNYIRSGQTGMVRIGSKVRIGTHNGNGIISLSGNNIDQSNGVSFSQVGNDIYIIRDGTLNIKTVAGGVTTSINNVGAFQTGSTATANGGMVVPTMVGYFWGNTSSGYSIASWTGSSGHMDFRVNNVTAATIDSAGRVGVGITTPEESAKLQVFSTTQGVLFPMLSQAQIDAIVNPADGLMVYHKTNKRMYWYDADRAQWMYNPIVEIGSGAPTSTPVCIADRYIDTTAKKEYVAVGTSSSSDWLILN
jgi:lysophospholipase L1-like esterase